MYPTTGSIARVRAQTTSTEILNLSWLAVRDDADDHRFVVKTRGVHRTHTPRGTSTGYVYSAATIDVASLPMSIEYRVYCVRVWSYPRCGSDRLLYIQQRAY